MEPSEQNSLHDKLNSSATTVLADSVDNMQHEVSDSEACLTENTSVSDSGKDECSRNSISSDDSDLSLKLPGTKYYFFYQGIASLGGKLLK